MSAVITPFEGTELFNTASFNNRISQINTGFSYVSNPNLLDNWYFGNPVDQRGGNISLKGVPVYNDAACTSLISNQIEVAATCIKSGTNYERRINGQGGGFVKAADVVRGYTGNGYTVDRWGILNNVTATLQNASLNIAYTESGWNLYTFLDNVLMPGTTYTLSCLYKASVNPIRLVCTWGTNKFFYNEQAPISDDWTLAEITGTIPADATIDTNEIVVRSLGSGAGNFSLKAIKLEIGPTQTLAHREGDKWALNEVPVYGEQLRRCQRYFVRINNVYASGHVALNTTTFVDFAVPVPLRTIPALTVRNYGQLSSAGTLITPTNIQVAAQEANHIYLSVTTPPLTTNQPACLHDASIDFSADL